MATNMKKVKFFALAGFTVKARSRDKAVRKFIKHGFSAFVAQAETELNHRDNPKPFLFLRG